MMKKIGLMKSKKFATYVKKNLILIVIIFIIIIIIIIIIKSLIKPDVIKLSLHWKI